jgi:hypothetical protein
MAEPTKYNRIKQLGKSAKMQRKEVFLYLNALVFLWIISLAGCAQNQKAAVKESKIESTGISHAMHAAEEVLGKMHFEIEKVDLQNGYIRTRPLAGAQFFEFWRRDNVGIQNQLLSNLHSIRRIVELNISRQTDEFNIDCKVRVQRLSMPQREITSSSQAYLMFTASSLLLQRLELNPEQKAGMAWIELDRDRKLEAEILNSISSMIIKENRKTSEGASAMRNKT